MKRIAIIAALPALLTIGCATGNSTSYTVTPDVAVTVKDTRKKAKSPYVQKQGEAAPIAGAAGGATR